MTTAGEVYYGITHFIEKFEAVQDKHLGLHSEGRDCFSICTEEEADALHRLTKPYGLILFVNDGDPEFSLFGGNTPKERVLNFLYYVKHNRPYYMG
jgi:hypothetical protein